MRRPQSAFGLAAVLAGLLVATLSPSPAHAISVPAEPPPAPTFMAAGSCTPWKGELKPPPTIRVLRTKRSETPDDVAGTVQEVDFRDYVATTMAVEWPEHYPPATLRAGAVATKQFAWYHVVNWRGGTKKVDGEKVCYDVIDTTKDQYYYPEKHGPGQPDGPGPKIMAAIDDTWPVTVRKYKPSTKTSRFFLTGYRAGTTSVCGADANGFKLFHRSTRACGQSGLTWREILRLYLKPNLEIVEPGRHHVLRSRHGDAAAMVDNAASQLVAHVWASGKPASKPTSNTGLKVASEDLVGYKAADLDGDGDDDLVWLRRTDARSGRLRVALSNGDGYGPDELWWEGDTMVPLAGARLLVGDFHADGRVDVGILGRGPEAGTSRLVVLKRRPFGAPARFANPVQWWSGKHDNAHTAAAWAGDLSGDGRADLIIRQDPASGGVRVDTAVTKAKASGGQRMNPLKKRFEDKSLDASKVRMAPGDANRDGREDLLVLIGGSGRARVERLQGGLAGGFSRVRMWTAPKSNPVTVKSTRLGIADIDLDGRSDMVLYSRAGSETRIRVLKSRYVSMQPGPDWRVAFAWGKVRPY